MVRHTPLSFRNEAILNYRCAPQVKQINHLEEAFIENIETVNKWNATGPMYAQEGEKSLFTEEHEKVGVSLKITQNM